MVCMPCRCPVVIRFRRWNVSRFLRMFRMASGNQFPISRFADRVGDPRGGFRALFPGPPEGHRFATGGAPPARLASLSRVGRDSPHMIRAARHVEAILELRASLPENTEKCAFFYFFYFGKFQCHHLRNAAIPFPTRDLCWIWPFLRLIFCAVFSAHRHCLHRRPPAEDVSRRS